MHAVWHNATIYINKNSEHIVMVTVSTSMSYCTSSVQVTTILKCYILQCAVFQIHGSFLHKMHWPNKKIKADSRKNVYRAYLMHQ